MVQGKRHRFSARKISAYAQSGMEYFWPSSSRNTLVLLCFKTTPQILLLRNIMQDPSFIGMAFTGIRAEESASRGEYDDISEGKKHTGQLSFHVIFDWNSAELYMHIYRNHLPLGESYFKGVPRAGCLVCPNAVGKVIISEG